MAASASSKSEKIVLVGDFGVGKSTIFTRFKTGAAKDVTLNTRKECECTRDLLVDGTKTSVSVFLLHFTCVLATCRSPYLSPKEILCNHLAR